MALWFRFLSRDCSPTTSSKQLDSDDVVVVEESLPNSVAEETGRTMKLKVINEVDLPIEDDNVVCVDWLEYVFAPHLY